MSDELDPRLKALYRQMPKEEPSAAVDKVILEAAGRPLPRGQAWMLSFGAAASVVLVSSLVVYLQIRSPETLREAVTPTVASTPPAAPQAAVMPEAASPAADSALSEAEMAARRSAELARLRAEMGLRPSGKSAEEVNTQAPLDLPVVRLSPPGGIANRQEAVAGSALNAPLEERMAPAAAPLARPDMAAGKLKSMTDDNPSRAGIASVLMEGVSLGMHREDLVALGWGCAQAVCTREITDPRQPDYWGMNSAGATQRVQFANEVVTAMTLSQSGVPLNNVKLSLERIGKPAEQACSFGAVGDLIVSRLAGRMLLSLWQEGEVTTLRVCLAK